MKMGGIVGLFLCAVLCASVGGVHGVCRHVNNNDMIEYSCTGGQLSDLDSLPASTGKIRIIDMPIRRITADTFSRFGSDLWVLGCSNCGIEDIEPGAFRQLDNLQQLSLDSNRLTVVKESWFRGLDYLTYLDLNYNNIETIEDGVFESLPSLVDLRLSGNRLECLNLADMSKLKELKRIFLSENSEFKCPNAVSAFLEERGVAFEKDPEWRKIPTDIVPVEYEYDTYDEETSIKPWTTPLPAYRERLHPTTTPPSTAMPSTVMYIPQRFYTTEEVVYPPVPSTPDWRTTTRPTTVGYEGRVEDTSAPPYLTRTPYTPPGTIAPIESSTYPSRETTQHISQEDVTTLRSWPRFPESTTARPEYPVYPPYENQDNDYTERPDYLSTVDSLSLAPSPDDGHRTPPYVEPTMESSTNPSGVDWQERNTVPSNVEYVPNFENRAMEPSETTHVVRPIPHSKPTEVHPVLLDNVYQSPYYETTITVHSPSAVDNQPQQVEVTPGTTPIETTTDKPLPECPTRNLSALSQSSMTMILASVLLAVARHVLVEGF